MVVVVAQITFYVSKLQHLYMYITYKNLSKLTKGSQWLWMQYYLNTDITVFIYLIPKKLTLIVVATTHLIVE